jgi:hypothetical protein
MRSLLLGFGLIFVAATSASAQAVSPAACSSAAAYVNGKALPAPNDTTLVWYALAMCGDVGESAAVQALQSAAVVSETDSARVQTFVTMFGLRRTAALFNAWQALILNPQASDIFKRLAIDTYGALYRPGTSFASPSMAATSVATCGLDIRTSGSFPTGPLSNLPADALNQLASTLASAASNASSSTATRAEANCWGLVLQNFVTPVASKIHGAYICGNKFSVTNTNPVSVVVKADVIPPSALQKIESYTTTVGKSGAVWTLPAVIRGNLRITFKGSVIQTVINSGTACP